MTNKETVYLEKIFTAVPLMSNDEKDRLLGIAEEMEREKGVEVAGQSAFYSESSGDLCYRNIRIRFLYGLFLRRH